jgi:CRISPR/Cas system-associated protein Cas5 (RAMP superfamily)
MRNINNKLRKNFRILSEQNFVENKAKITRNKLATVGFDFEYFTNIKTYKNGAQYFFVYDFGYKLLEEDYILVVRKEEN